MGSTIVALTAALTSLFQTSHLQAQGMYYESTIPDYTSDSSQTFDSHASFVARKKLFCPKGTSKPYSVAPVTFTGRPVVPTRSFTMQLAPRVSCSFHFQINEKRHKK